LFVSSNQSPPASDYFGFGYNSLNFDIDFDIDTDDFDSGSSSLTTRSSPELSGMFPQTPESMYDECVALPDSPEDFANLTPFFFL